ncbi:MAG: dihydrolipoyl dehydrogenase [Burkholderiaceae bacterium]|nr:dihydrolipoyl dehydrogenase [Burkholderiaceae bacterium]
MRQLNTDVAIIGAGTAGMAAYKAVKKAGKTALLIEGGPYGTTCARVGCMPSKLLIAAADAAHGISMAPAFGVDLVGEVKVDGERVMARVRNERDRFVSFVLDSIAAMPDADKIRGHARFIADTVLQVDDHTQIQAGGIVIATGSSPVVPEIYRSLGRRVLINDDVFDWQTLPRSVLVVGSGVIGLEIGQALTRLGVKVCLVNRSASLGGISDPEVKASARAAFQDEMDMRLDTDVHNVQLQGDDVHVVLKSRDGRMSTEVVDYVLVATGRRPNLDALSLENTSIVLNEQGLPTINPLTLQLGEAPVFIAGDVTGKLAVLHEANDEGYIAAGNALRYPDVVTPQRSAPLMVVFSDPQLAQVGLRFKDLPKTGVVFGQVSFVNQGRSRIILKNQGMLRLYADSKDGRLLGAEMAGPAMEHIAHLLAWCVQQKLSVNDMLSMPFYHPVIEEGLRTALRHAAAELATAGT